MPYFSPMEIFNWDSDKNAVLISERSVSFDEVVAIIESGHILDIIEYHNEEKYSNQNIYILDINSYAYLVPFVKNENEIFLKNIIPSRKATKKYLDERY